MITEPNKKTCRATGHKLNKWIEQMHRLIYKTKKNKVQNIQNQHLLNKYSRQKRAKFTICMLFALAERTVYVLYH